MKKEIFLASDGALMNYEVFSPNEFVQNLPLILFLHGAGERGTDISHLARHAIPRLLEAGTEIPAVVLCPQCPANCVWDTVPFDVKTILDAVALRYAVDKTRITVTGGSMGGFGTWTMGMMFPNFFAAMAPVAGGGMSWRAPNLVKTPIRAYHGEQDEAVPVIYTRLMVEKVNHEGGHAEMILLPGYRHNDGINAAYESYGAIDWLLAQKRTDFSPVPETLSRYF